MTAAIEQSPRFGSSTTDRRVDSYTSPQSPSRRWTDEGNWSPEDPAERRAKGLGWFSIGLGLAQIGAPRLVARLIGIAERAYGKDNFSLIVTADHGGHKNNHGSSDLRDVTIPWIAWGKGVKPGVLQPSVIRTMDTASTVLWLLGLTAPDDWDGHAVIDAYEQHLLERLDADRIADARLRLQRLDVGDANRADRCLAFGLHRRRATGHRREARENNETEQQRGHCVTSSPSA